MTESGSREGRSRFRVNVTSERQDFMNDAIDFIEHSQDFVGNHMHNFNSRFHVFFFAVALCIKCNLVQDDGTLPTVTNAESFITNVDQVPESLRALVESLYPNLCEKYSLGQTIEILGDAGLQEMEQQTEHAGYLPLGEMMSGGVNTQEPNQ